MPVVPFEPEVLRWTIQFGTQVLKALNGTERQRIARLRDPRERYELEFIVGGNHQPVDDLRDVHANLFTDPASTYEVAARYEAVVAATTITSTSVTVDGTYADWMVATQRVWIENQKGEGYATSISSVGGSGASTVLTLADSPPGGKTFAAGLTHVYPLEALYLDDGQALGHYPANEVGRWQLGGQRSSFRATWGTGATLATFDGYTVLDRRPEREGLAAERFDAGVERIDEGATLKLIWHRSRADIARAHVAAVVAGPERQWWKKFLYAVKGRQKAFLLPTWRADLSLFASAGGTTVEINGPTLSGGVDYVNKYFPSLAHRRLQFLMPDGTVQYRKVTAATTGGSGQQILTLDAAISATGARISFLELCRFADDRVTWTVIRGADQASFNLDVIVVQDDGAAVVDYETSRQDSAPIELLEVTVGATVYRYTTWHSSYTYSAQTWTPVAGGRGAVTLGPPNGNHGNEATLRLPANDALVLATAFGVPPDSVTAKIIRVQTATGVGVELARGKLSWSIDGDRATGVISSLLGAALATELPSKAHQRPCQHVLYDGRCGAVRTDFDQAATVSSISGSTVVVSTVGGQPDGWFAGGEIVRDSDGARRTIVAQIGTTLTLNLPFRTLAATNPVTLYAGCDHTIQTCKDKFNRVVDYSGFPYPKKPIGPNWPFKIQDLY